MALRRVRIGAIPDAVQYDDADFAAAVETDQPIRAGTPAVPTDVLRLDDVGVITGDVIGPAGAVDSDIVEFNGVTGKLIKDSGLTHADIADAISKKHTQNTDTDLSPGHKDATTGVHGVGAGIVAKVSDIAVDGNLSAAAQAAISASHTRSHALDSTSDHSIGGLTNTYLVKSDGTKLVPATNTDAQVADAITKKHTQGTDQGLDTGGANAVTAAQAKAGYTHSGVVVGNPHNVTKSEVGLGNVDNKSEATIIADVKADADVADAISKKHARSHTISSTSDHSDVNLAGISNNDLMQWDDPSSKWVPKTIQEVINGQSLTITKLTLAVPTELTISAGAVTATQARHTIDTEGDAASDDLTTISGGAAGQILIISAADDARTVVCKKGAGLLIQDDFSLDSVDDTLMLECKSSGVWREIARASNG